MVHSAGAQNVVLIGEPGTCKTYVATTLGVQAMKHHRKKVRFFATVDLVDELAQEKAMNKAGQLAECLIELPANFHPVAIGALALSVAP